MRANVEEMLEKKREGVKLLKKGVAPVKIAEQLGVSRTAVYGWKKNPSLELKKSGPKVDKKAQKEAFRLFHEGYMVMSISKHINVSHTTVYGWLKDEKRTAPVIKKPIGKPTRKLSFQEKFEEANKFRKEKNRVRAEKFLVEAK